MVDVPWLHSPLLFLLWLYLVYQLCRLEAILTMVILTTAILTMQPTLEAIFLDICGAAAERSAPSSGGGGGGSGDDGGGGGGGGGSPRTRVAPAISPPMATAEAVARSAAHSGVPLAKLATPVEFDGGGLQSC